MLSYVNAKALPLNTKRKGLKVKETLFVPRATTVYTWQLKCFISMFHKIRSQITVVLKYSSQLPSFP